MSACFRVPRLLSALVVIPLYPQTPAPVAFNRDVRPIMADTCFRCHGPDKSSRMAGLRLDLRDEALKTTKSGITPIVPGDPDQSAIIQRVFATDAKVMPPKYAHKELSEAQKATLRRWVAEGAKYEGHWAYEPVRRPEVPTAAVHPIDAFLQARLRKEGLAPSPEADLRTLLRRVTLDLTGLPPTPEEMTAFLADQRPGAYERVVERLMASPRYAERQATPWLDAVRYADTAGFHGDNPFPAWPYRDWVLRALRDNMPFNRFTREQLAGDLLPNATADQRIASAFNRLSRMSAEGGLQPKEYLAKYAADRVRTVSNTWLGSTMGCAECHDHKFDPILTKDFYAMKAFFADIDETGLVPDRGAKAWGNKLALPSAEQKQQQENLEQQRQEAKQALDNTMQELTSQQAAWEQKILAQHASGELAWRFQRPLSARSKNGAALTIYNDEPIESNFYHRGTLVTEKGPGRGLVVASGPNPDNETYTVRLHPGAGTWTALGIEAHQDESLPGTRVARGADRFVLTEVEALLINPGQQPRPLRFVLANSSQFGEMPEHNAMTAIDGDPRTGWGMSFGEMRSPFLALRFARKVRTTSQSVLVVRLRHDSDYRKATIGRFRLALSQAEYAWPESGDDNRKAALSKPGTLTLTIAADGGVAPDVLAALKVPAAQRTGEQAKAVREYFLWSQLSLEPLVARAARLETEAGLLDAAIPKVVISKAVEPRETRVLPRGNWMDESGPIVEPAVPEFLGKLPVEGRATRLDLANWLVSPDNPLTARVYVNRLWRQFFGTGLSKVLDDLGSQGEWPTNPELLDWLAAEFMQPSWQPEGTHAWDMKHMVRLIVTSHAYRQSSKSTPQLDERDPDNRLLARQSRFRVDAETVRDLELFVSGLLAERFGGPSVKPYEPEGYLAAMNFPKREYSASRGPDLYRRGLYTLWQRTFLHPEMGTFDASTREECTVNRVNSNTPLQALVLLNDPTFVEASRVFAANILKHGGTTFASRLNWAYQRALNRAPTPEERRILADLHQQSVMRFQARPAATQQLLHIGESPLPAVANPAELASMTTVARAILNLHETITRN